MVYSLGQRVGVHQARLVEFKQEVAGALEGGIVIKDGVDLARGDEVIDEIGLAALPVAQVAQHRLGKRELAVVPLGKHVDGVGLQALFGLRIDFLHGLEHVDHVFQRVRLRIARLGVNVPADVESVAARVDAKGVGAHVIRNAVQLARSGRMVIAGVIQRGLGVLYGVGQLVQVIVQAQQIASLHGGLDSLPIC